MVCRLVGDLIYLDVITLEGNKFSITGSTKMFYVNSSSANTLDLRPSKASFEATTLVALLQKISPRFKKGSSVIVAIVSDLNFSKFYFDTQNLLLFVQF